MQPPPQLESELSACKKLSGFAFYQQKLFFNVYSNTIYYYTLITILMTDTSLQRRRERWAEFETMVVINFRL